MGRTAKQDVLLLCLLLTLLLGLTGCKGAGYKQAVAYQEEKDYASAAAIYQTLEDYKDSAQRLAQCNAMLAAIGEYQSAERAANEKNVQLAAAISAAEALIAEGKKPLDDTLIPALETAVSEAKAAQTEIPAMPETAGEIEDVAEALKRIDYTAVLEPLSARQSALKHSIKQYALVDAPAEEYIIQCLETVSHVKNIAAATEDNDPNGNLNKAGGYTAQVYFSVDLVNQASIRGSSVIEKGTDCGGSIEVYATPEDAEKRNIYLSAFDGTIFASGSHTVVGTVVVRTSDKLKASQQKQLETEIISVLTSVEGSDWLSPA